MQWDYHPGRYKICNSGIKLEIKDNPGIEDIIDAMFAKPESLELIRDMLWHMDQVEDTSEISKVFSDGFSVNGALKRLFSSAREMLQPVIEAKEQYLLINNSEV